MASLWKRLHLLWFLGLTYWLNCVKTALIFKKFRKPFNALFLFFYVLYTFTIHFYYRYTTIHILFYIILIYICLYKFHQVIHILTISHTYALKYVYFYYTFLSFLKNTHWNIFKARSQNFWKRFHPIDKAILFWYNICVRWLSPYKN